MVRLFYVSSCRENVFESLLSCLGIYELEINAADCSMTGHKKDQPANWRKAKHLRSLNPADSSDSSQDHSHNHDH